MISDRVDISGHPTLAGFLEKGLFQHPRGYFDSYPHAGESDTIRERFARDCRPTRANIGGLHAKPEKEQGRAAN
jgi:hypothetical protein